MTDINLSPSICRDSMRTTITLKTCNQVDESRAKWLRCLHSMYSGLFSLKAFVLCVAVKQATIESLCRHRSTTRQLDGVRRAPKSPSRAVVRVSRIASSTNLRTTTCCAADKRWSEKGFVQGIDIAVRGNISRKGRRICYSVTETHLYILSSLSITGPSLSLT